MGTLSINGNSEIKVTPEITAVTVMIDGITDDYQESLKENTERAKEIKDIIKDNGIPKDDIKSLDFWVKESWNSWWDKDKEKYRTKFNGYKYHQRLVFRFHNDNKVLSSIVYRTGSLEMKPSVDVSFVTEKRKEYESQLLKDAMKNAISKAEALAEAGNFSLKCIENIDVCEDRRRNEDAFCCCEKSIGPEDEFDMDLEPEDFIMSKEVEVTWVIG